MTGRLLIIASHKIKMNNRREMIVIILPIELITFQ